MPLLNDRDELVARLVLSATLSGHANELWHEPSILTAALRRAFDRHITRFSKKMSCRWRATGSRLAGRELMISAAVRQSVLPGELQHALFDSRAEHAAQAGIDEAEQTSRRSRRVIDRLTDHASIRAGALTIEVVWIPRA